ncbi:MAG: DUF1906 domain-containing protein [Acidobacteria bacterium]|nr:DUF1906 domain-containing protein [Acidobacteriota bacterium]
MKRIATLSFSLLLLVFSTTAFGRTPSNPFSVYNQDSPFAVSSSVIKGIQVFGKRSGIAYTADSLYRTDDSGTTWQELPLTFTPGFRIAAVSFSNNQDGLVLLATSDGAFELARTTNGGETWSRAAAVFENSDLLEINTDDIRLSGSPNGILQASARIPTSSNFVGKATYRSNDGGRSWNLVSRAVEPWNEGEATGTARFGNWVIETSGECVGHKVGCVQTSRLSILGKDATPPQLRDRARVEFEKARTEADQNRMFAAPPGGSIRTSLNRGFDKCQAGSVAQMQSWWDNSYFFDTNIYFSGRNRACPSQPFTNNPAWINSISAQGWGIIPTVVGYQSPCTASTTTAKLSYDPVVAETQGRGEADIAATDAASIGLTAGSVLYYDMERYDPPSPDTLGCRAATVAFLKGWTERIREIGYVSGTYGSPKNAIEDWQFMPPASRMDAVWMARWDNVISVWTYVTFSNFPTNVWDNHQRIKQWQAPHNETWAGITFNIDGNVADGPVAGIPVPRNKVADFDGDGRTDVSVFRPGTGEWFIAGTLGPSFSSYGFGIAEDVPTPGDYDGDGKTDLAVFRPSNSTWYVRAKGSFSFRQWGEAGDIPAQADYNGDRRTDFAVFRPSTGVWYIALSDSLNTFVQTPFGQNGDQPASGDYDGDGRADIAVWRPSNGTWYVLGSTAGYTVVELGVPGDLPVQGDYDGDGKIDRAVFRGSSGTWHLLQSTEGSAARQFGVEGDVPVTGDYDGDGRFDISVFRPSNGTWYVSQGPAGYTARQFGVADDKPIPREYLPR